jgi:hypothetical protein
MARKFKDLMSSSDLENKYRADDTCRYGLSLYSYWFLEKADEVASLLFDCRRHYGALERNARTYEEEKEMEKQINDLENEVEEEKRKTEEQNTRHTTFGNKQLSRTTNKYTARKYIQNKVDLGDIHN